MRFISNQWLQRILLFSFSVCFYAAYENNTFEIFQGRDIRRAFELLHGHWIWHGPELLGGGTTPGPFYYWLLALPLAIFGKWQSLIWFEYFLAAATAVCLLEFGKKRFSPLSGWLMFFLFLNSSVIRNTVEHFWNPSYVLIFQVLTLILLFDLKSSKKNMLGAFLIGLAVQIHYTQLVFLLGAVLAIIFDSSRRLSERTKALAKILLAFALPLIPYLIWKLSLPGNSTLLSESGGLQVLFLFRASSFQELANHCINQIHILIWRLSNWPSLPLRIAIWGMLALLLLSQRKLINLPRSRFLWASFAVSTLLAIKILLSSVLLRYGLPFIFLTFVITAAVGSEVEKRLPKLFLSTLGAVTAAWVVWTLFEYGRQIPGVLFQWQTLTMIVLMLAIFAGQLRQKTKAVVGILLFATFVSAGITLTKQKFNDPVPGFAHDLRERNGLALALAKTTRWTWNHLRERTYLVGIHPETEFSILYEQAARETTAPAELSADGILVIHSTWGKFFEPGRELPSEPNWIALKDHIPLEMFNAATTQQLACKKMERTGGFQICYYEFSSQKKPLWNNIGYPYQYAEPPLTKVIEPFTITSSSANQAIFHFNVCNNREPACTLYFEVKINPDKTLKIKAYGDPIGMPHGSFSPAWTASIRNPQLEVQCEKTARQYSIASSLGVPLEREKIYPRPFFLAPYETIFSMDCQKPTMVAILVSEEAPSDPIKLLYRQLLDKKRLVWNR